MYLFIQNSELFVVITFELIAVEFKLALSSFSSSCLLRRSNASDGDAWSELSAMPTVDDTLLEQATDFICRQVFCRPEQTAANAVLLRSVLEELEVQNCVPS